MTIETDKILKDLGDRVNVPDLDECGPAMRALNENQRRYVCALGVFGNAMGLAYQWAYGIEKSSVGKAAASRLGAQQKIKDAIKENFQGKLHVLGPALAAERILEALGPSNSDIKLALKAAELASNIIPGFKAATAHEITVKHEYSLVDLEKRRVALEQELGIVPALPNPNIMDAEFTEVAESVEGLEDLF